MNYQNNFLEKELTYKLIGTFINISKLHGCHFKENIYYKLLINEFLKVKILFVQFPKINIYNSKNSDFLGCYQPDFLIEDKIILEIKACLYIHQSHIDQLIKYLKSSFYEVGFIVNFGTERAQIIRRVSSNNRKTFIDNRK